MSSQKIVIAEKAAEKAADARSGKAFTRGHDYATRSGRNAMPEKKTVAEQEAEMTDSFGGLRLLLMHLPTIWV